MYCSQCGKQMEPTARFCSECGSAFAPANPNAQSQGGQPYTAAPPIFHTRLTRPREGRMIAGVCAAFAREYGWDVAVIRIILALCVLCAGTGVLAYVIAWIIIPDAPYAMPNPTTGATA